MKIPINSSDFIDIKKEQFLKNAKLTLRTKQDNTIVLVSVELNKDQIDLLISGLITAKAAL